MSSLPHLVVIGSGPIGLELASRAIDSYRVTLIEKEADIAGNVHSWSTVRLFSPWSMNTSPNGLRILEELNVSPPNPESYPTGEEYISSYLTNLKTYLLKNSNFELKLSTQVISCVRQNSPKGSMSNRTGPFRILLESNNLESNLTCDKLVDCSGTYSNPSPIGGDGQYALGERALSSKIIRNLNKNVEDILGGKIVLVGSGATAITFINKIVESASEGDEETEVVWITRREKSELYKRIENDPLPQRDALSALAQDLLTTGKSKNLKITHVKSQITELSKPSSWIIKTNDGGEITATHLISCTGFRPNNSIFQELQVHQCYASEGPMKLAGYLLSQGGGGGDCLSQVSPGPGLLKNPEKDFFVLGMKSYGRGSAFLVRIGLEQVEMCLGLLEGKDE